MTNIQQYHAEMVGHAVAFLGNHGPKFAEYHKTNEGAYAQAGALAIDDAPPAVQASLQKAAVAAADFLAFAFSPPYATETTK